MKQARIDIHAHAFPRAFLEHLAKLEPDDVRLREHVDGRLIALWNKAPLPEFRVEERLAAMAREQVSVEVLSAPPVYGRFCANTAALCSLMNELQEELAAQHPGRFLGFIHLPYHEPERALAELRRFQDHPSFVGVTLASNMNGRYPDASLDWLWGAASEADLPLFVHPVAPVHVESPISLPLVHFPGDTTVFASSMILSGVLERFPNLKVILAHLGGSLSVLGSRLDMISHPHFPPHPGSDLPRLPSEYVRKFYVDTAQGFSEAAYVAAFEAFGADHMLYGSDYFLMDTPWREDLNAFLEPRLRDPKLRNAVLEGNARRLLRLPGAEPTAQPTVCS